MDEMNKIVNEVSTEETNQMVNGLIKMLVDSRKELHETQFRLGFLEGFVATTAVVYGTYKAIPLCKKGVRKVTDWWDRETKIIEEIDKSLETEK